MEVTITCKATGARIMNIMYVKVAMYAKCLQMMTIILHHHIIEKNVNSLSLPFQLQEKGNKCCAPEFNSIITFP